MEGTDFLLTFSCPDRSGLVHAVSSWLVDRDCNIIDSDQFGDAVSQRFFMRVHFSGDTGLEQLHDTFEPVAVANDLDWQIWPRSVKPKVLILVSKIDHCLIDLLNRVRIGDLAVEIALVISNHADLADTVTSQGVEFLHLPVTSETKLAQEQRVLEEIKIRNIDFIVLARYMQILTAEFCAQFPGRVINIHHSFLPSFKGAKPYAQAHAHGVKLIGATAHYVTADLDEGPIIEQGAERVHHRMTPAELVAVGRDIERIVLAKAVRYQAEHRVLINGNRTVVFS